MRSGIGRLGVGAFATLALAGSGALGLAEGQTVPERRWDEPELVYERDFSDLRSLRALSTGAIIAVEGIGGEVVILDPDGQGETEVGGRGQGPDEYMDPAAVLPLATSDISMLVDPALQRLLIIGPDGNVMVSERWRLPPATVPAGRDAGGGMYFDEAGAVRLDRAGQVAVGPGALVRLVQDQTTDTLAWINVYDLAARWEASPVSKIFNPGPGGVALFALDRSPFGAQDQWGLMADGTIAIARARPYRVDIVAPDGTLTEGSVIETPAIRVTDEDREAFVAGINRAQQGGAMSFSLNNGETVPVSRPGPDEADFSFPEEKPPFPFGGLHVTQTEILVQRHVRHDEDHSLIDVFDTGGALRNRLLLPPGRTLVGATDDALYALVYNDLDVQLLERYGR